MSNFNKRFNNLCARVNFWFNLSQHLASSEKFSHSQGHLTADDVKALKLIHHELAECCRVADDRLILHKKNLYSLRKEG